MALRRPIDHLFGQRFGRWTIISEAPKPSDYKINHRFVEVRCDCGTVNQINVQSVTRGLSTSCGCWRSEKARRLHKSAIDGQRFGRLTVLGRETKNLWRCRCDCGNEAIVRRQSLIKGATKSCGCLVVDLASVMNLTHGLTGTAEHRIWKHMRTRCYNPNSPKFPRYGGRGIIMCDRWRDSFSAFLKDMGPRPDGASIDRINNDGNYEPGNVRWATPRQQSNNTRRNVRVSFRGETKTVAEWARSIGLKSPVLWLRLYRYHWPIERALTEPARLGRRPVK